MNAIGTFKITCLSPFMHTLQTDSSSFDHILHISSVLTSKADGSVDDKLELLILKGFWSVHYLRYSTVIVSA